MPKEAKRIRKSVPSAAFAKRARINDRPNLPSSASSVCNMNSTKLHPLDIPEILLLIGSFLKLNDLINCIRVSKTFHKTLIRLIWRKIIIGPKGYPIGEALQNNKQYIEEIMFKVDKIPEEYGSLQGCGRLQSIDYKRRYSWSQATHFLDLIKPHSSTITRICLGSVRTPRGLWEGLLECVHLNRLELSHIRIDHEFDIFFQVCKKLGYLDMDSLSIHQLPINFLSSGADDDVLPKIHTLRIKCVCLITPPDPYTSSYFLGMLVRKCPGLCVLEYGGQVFSIRDTEQSKNEDFFKEAFLQHPWTLDELSELSLPFINITNEDMATLLRRMTELRQLDVGLWDFGQLPLQELLAEKQEVLENGHMVRRKRLRRLCETVETLILDLKCAVEDGVVQTILSNCPRLRKFAGSKITVTEIVNGAEWVSTGLTRLDINLLADVDQETAEGMAKARIAFKQLGKLTQLRQLNLTTSDLISKGRRTLDLRLRAGLDELSNLKSLQTLSLRNDDHQRTQLEDAKWIVENWPNIRCLDGHLGDRTDKHHSVHHFLRSYNIYVGAR